MTDKLPKCIYEDGTLAWEVYPSADGYSVSFANNVNLGQWPTPEIAAEYATKYTTGEAP